MKKTIAIALMALASAAFGSQATQVERAKLEHIAAVERAKYERIRAAEHEKYVRQYIKLLYPDNRPAVSEKKASTAPEKKVNVAKVWVPGHWKDVKEKRKVVNVKNTLGRGVSSGPAIRRK